MKRTYHGSCHCGAVRFEVELDLAAGTSKCNCTACGKGRFWKAIVSPDAFRLLQGHEVLADYSFGSQSIHHRFCSRCGIKPFGQAAVEGIGPFVAINVAALDDATPEELAAAPVLYEDGRHDRWDRAPAVTTHL